MQRVTQPAATVEVEGNRDDRRTLSLTHPDSTPGNERDSRSRIRIRQAAAAAAAAAATGANNSSLQQHRTERTCRRGLSSRKKKLFDSGLKRYSTVPAPR